MTKHIEPVKLVDTVRIVLNITVDLLLINKKQNKHQHKSPKNELKTAYPLCPKSFLSLHMADSLQSAVFVP